MSIGTYVLTDKRTGKFYVGSSHNVDKRIERHLRDLNQGNHHCQPLQELWYGNNVLVKSVFSAETREDAYVLEQDILDRYQDSPLLLNVGKGVKGGDNLSRNPNREAILQRMRVGLHSWLDVMTPLEKKLLFGKHGDKNGMYGRTHTPKVKKMLSEVGSRPENIERLMAVRETQAYHDGLSRAAKARTGVKNTFFGKQHSPETKQLLSDKLKGQLPPNLRPVEVEGVRYESLTDAARKLGIGATLMLYRLKSTKDKYKTYRYLTPGPTTTESTQGQNE